MKERKLSETERNNKAVMIGHGIEVSVMFLLFLIEFLTGSRSAGRLVADVILGLGPVAAEYYFWRQDHETPMIKHIVGVGYAVYYTVILFTTTNNLEFVFVIPMIVLITIFSDLAYSIKINTGTVILSLIATIGGGMTGKFGYENVSDAVLQVVAMILVATCSVVAAWVTQKNTRQRVGEALEAKQQAEEMVKKVGALSARMHDGIKNIYGELELLNKASKSTMESMEQLSTGAVDTADAVQRQTAQTAEIQNELAQITEATGSIRTSMHQTLDALEAGQKDMDTLVSQVEVSVENGADVANKLQTLDEYVAQMHEIVKMISSIATQTSTLALNASIEAARAGEAGRGFAVVATQVTNMAGQTKNATQNITELINNVSRAINEVVDVIQQMLKGIQEQKKSADSTASSFSAIQDNTQNVRVKIRGLIENIDELKDANQQIVDSIQTISAISEEVAAQANETSAEQETNGQTIERMDAKMHDLILYITKQQKKD